MRITEWSLPSGHAALRQRRGNDMTLHGRLCDVYVETSCARWAYSQNHHVKKAKSSYANIYLVHADFKPTF